MEEDKIKILHKEIDLIQSVINRIATNSFLLKGWFLSIFAIVLTMNTKDINGSIIDIKLLLLPIVDVLFWYLDAFFLQKEKRYRKLYDWVIKNRISSHEYYYDLNHTRFSKDTNSVLITMFSKTLVMFYGVPIALFLILFLTSKI